MYAYCVYEVLKKDCEGMDAIYEDYIIQQVGVKGLEALIKDRRVESCGVINGRRLYVLCETGS